MTANSTAFHRPNASSMEPMRQLMVRPAPRWFSVKWWEPESHDDIAERISLSVSALREKGFTARFNQGKAVQRGEYENYTQTACRVEVYGTKETFNRARLLMRGFWAAMDSRGCTPDYQAGFLLGMRVLNGLGRAGPALFPPTANIPPWKRKRLRSVNP
jgi:hypothetical protein